MISIESNLLCDDEDCWPELVTGEPVDSAEEAIKSAKETARSEGWKENDGKWYCSDCATKRELNQAVGS